MRARALEHNEGAGKGVGVDRAIGIGAGREAVLCQVQEEQWVRWRTGGIAV